MNIVKNIPPRVTGLNFIISPVIIKIKLNKIKNVIGKNTTAAIRAGFYHGYSGLIDNIIKMIIKQSGK